MPGDGSGIPGWFIALFVIVGLVGISTAIWKFSVLRSGGLNPFVATEQLEARLYQNLTEPANTAGKSTEQRLAELEDLHTRGVITDDELTAGRAKIIGSS